MKPLELTNLLVISTLAMERIIIAGYIFKIILQN